MHTLWLKINRLLIPVELATTPAEITRGLMGRAEDSARMLFVFPRAERHGMWMQNTPTALSVAWLRADGLVISTEEMEPFTTVVHRAPEPVRLALELPKGLSRSAGIKPGVRLVLASSLASV